MAFTTTDSFCLPLRYKIKKSISSMNTRLTFSVCFFVLLNFHAVGQTKAEIYFNKIRNNTAQLTAFMSQMPKGGDLHHHYSGSIYAEPMMERAIAEDFFLNTQTFAVSKNSETGMDWVKFSTLATQGKLTEYKIKTMSRWSVKDYTPSLYPSDKLFFESFDKFSPASKGHFEEGLIELKNRAVKENVSYLETQLSSVIFSMESKDLNKYDDTLRGLNKKQDEFAVMQTLQMVYDSVIARGAVTKADSFNTQFVESIYNKLHLDDDRFTLRYQNYVGRYLPPVELFKRLILNFISADRSDLIAGVNIVSPEDGDVSMKDYWLHMLMFKFCHQKYPSVKYTLHAGELTLGLVQPEELTWHINSAVRTGGANRIGHGVDMAYEENCYDLLRYMHKNKIPVEINLVSNEFILKVKDDKHPIQLYNSFHVPIIISSDDAGILRTNLTEQYVLLAKRYTFVRYADIKKFVFNSIDYSFIKDEKVKATLRANLQERFKVFEANIPE